MSFHLKYIECHTKWREVKPKKGGFSSLGRWGISIFSLQQLVCLSNKNLPKWSASHHRVSEGDGFQFCHLLRGNQQLDFLRNYKTLVWSFVGLELWQFYKIKLPENPIVSINDTKVPTYFTIALYVRFTILWCDSAAIYMALSIYCPLSYWISPLIIHHSHRSLSVRSPHFCDGKILCKYIQAGDWAGQLISRRGT